MPNSSVNYSYIEKIVSSPQFRSMQDKTQLFYSAPKRQVRTRLTHTIEVKVIARDIGIRINGKTTGEPVDLDLIDAIALAHDIGHTPFGHIGERTINAIVSRKDDLDGQLRPSGSDFMRFKHNVNSYRILRAMNIGDWRIAEGALCHTRVFYKGDGCSAPENPYDPFRGQASAFEQFLKTQHRISSPPDTDRKLPSLTLEGQIVAIADEIAQRVADISDGLESRYFEYIKRVLDIDPAGNTREKLEQCIRETLIEDVVSSTVKKQKTATPEFARIQGIHHHVFREEVVTFSPDMSRKNHILEEFITVMMAQSEDVRESDSRSAHILRQLFKAYLHDVSLLPDSFIVDYFNRVVNKGAFAAALSALSREEKTAAQANVLRKIMGGEWRYTRKLPGSKTVIDLNNVRDYFAIVIGNEHSPLIPELNELFDEYLLNIGFHIAGMTNTEAFTAYNRIYGH